MILAAGLGERMRPLTDHVAKPALPILDEPLVLGLLRWMARHGVRSVVVNAHAHADTLRAAVRDAPLPVEVLLEPELLDSGGGIAGARKWLEDGDEPILVVNGDMALELDLDDMLRTHRARDPLATLALRRDPRTEQFGTLGWNRAGDICRIRSRYDTGGEVGAGVFIGVQILSPEIFDALPDERVFGTMAGLYVPALRAGRRLARYEQPPDQRWVPVGTPRELLDANLQALERVLADRPGRALVARDALVHGELIGPAWIGPRAVVAEGAVVGPRAVVSGGAAIEPGTELTDSLVLPGAHPPRGVSLSRAVVFDDKVWRDG